MAGRKTDTPTIRCAIYTRKSTEEGLEQEFNSLDAQREAGEAFIASQKSEGWVCLPDRYDDGGYTGGNMERPALKRLMADIEAGQIDCVVVYKVDRLSRSLLDFTRIMEALDKHGVSFVSVTQQFNTTSSMGRLTLNILLSFAQFEREIISERTRDKIAAARRKGKWSGGRPILGYDVDPEGGRLLVNEAEAARVRAIYEIYLDRESLIATIAELDARGWTNKQWTNKKGRESGGAPFNKHSLYSLLTNVLYTGRLDLQGRDPRRGATGDRGRRDVPPRQADPEAQRGHRRQARPQPVRRDPQGPDQLRAVQLRHGADAHDQAGPALPVLRLRQRPEARLAQLPVEVDPRRRDREVRGRPGARHRARSGAPGRDVGRERGPRPRRGSRNSRPRSRASSAS